VGGQGWGDNFLRPFQEACSSLTAVLAIPEDTGGVIEVDMLSCNCIDDELVDAVDKSCGPSCHELGWHGGMLKSVGL